jgi:integrase
MAKIRTRILPSGKRVFVADFKDQNGKRRNKNFDRKREAEAFLDEVKRQKRSGEFVMDDDSVTVASAANTYLASAAVRSLEANTQAPYEQHVRLYIRPLIGNVLLTQLTERKVYEFLDDVVEQCSASMAKKVLGTLNRIIKDAQRRGLVGRNIVSDKGIKAPRVEPFIKRMPEKAELSALFSNTEGYARALLLTATLTGMRQGELRALTWDHVLFEERLIRVRRAGRSNGTVKGTKTHKGYRDIPISRALVRHLKEWKLACPKGEKNLVFPNGKGNMESPSNIRNRIFIPAMQRIGLAPMEVNEDGVEVPRPAFRFHDLRHAAAALFIEQGGNPKRIQDLMGHKSIQLTFDTYGYLFRDAEADAAAVDAISASLLA